MFKLAKKQTFTHEVKVRTPVDGGYRDEAFKAKFDMITIEERGTFDISKAEGTGAFLKRVVIGLEEVVDESNKPVPYSDELRDQLINLPHTRQALAAAYFEAVANDPKAGN